jgi:hypothetical protein
MLFASLSVALLSSSFAHARLGQVPVVNGVIGGVPTEFSNVAAKVPNRRAGAPLVSGAPVPGKLRYVENSGICGGYSAFRRMNSEY